MSIPRQKALLGEDGVLVGAAYLVVFNLVLWSYGLLEMSGDRRSLSVKKLVFNPGMIGLAAGLVVFLLPFPLPEVFAVPIDVYKRQSMGATLVTPCRFWYTEDIKNSGRTAGKGGAPAASLLP